MTGEKFYGVKEAASPYSRSFVILSRYTAVLTSQFRCSGCAFDQFSYSIDTATRNFFQEFSYEQNASFAINRIPKLQRRVYVCGSKDLRI